MTAVQLSREKERLIEENRKLRLEKAALENLRRVETIATRELGLQSARAREHGGGREPQSSLPPGAPPSASRRTHRERRAELSMDRAPATPTDSGPHAEPASA